MNTLFSRCNVISYNLKKIPYSETIKAPSSYTIFQYLYSIDISFKCNEYQALSNN